MQDLILLFYITGCIISLGYNLGFFATKCIGMSWLDVIGVILQIILISLFSWLVVGIFLANIAIGINKIANKF